MSVLEINRPGTCTPNLQCVTQGISAINTFTTRNKAVVGKCRVRHLIVELVFWRMMSSKAIYENMCVIQGLTIMYVYKQMTIHEDKLPCIIYQKTKQTKQTNNPPPP